MDRKRLGWLGLIALVLNQFVGLWDWWSRAHSLDPYFGAQRDTFWGHLLVALLSPFWLVVIAVFFGLLWCRKPTIDKTPEDASPRLRKPEDGDLRAALTACQQALKEEQGRNLTLVSENQSLKKDSEKLERIAPLIRDYRATHALLGELVVFVEGMEQIHPSGNISSDVQRIQDVSNVNAERYNNEFRYRVISLVTDIRTKYGLLHAGLADDLLVRDIMGAVSAKPIIDGLAYIHEELRKSLADAAGNLNV